MTKRNLCGELSMTDKDELLSMFKDVELNNFEQIKIHKPNNGASLSQLLRYAFNDY